VAKRGKLTKKQASKKDWLWRIGNLASWLCFIHCLATVVLTFVAPSLLKLMPHNFYYELGAWVFVLISSLFLLSRVPREKWHMITFISLALAGTIVLLLDRQIANHNYFAACFMALAIFQLYLTLSHHIQEHSGDDECCQHPHHVHHETKKVEKHS